LQHKFYFSDCWNLRWPY